ncbi:helix-turn-helix transcriptional regulator [Paenibacillus sp. FJAT-26967]|uniref:helix-turn-helix transcriptional regulator n=1 Tax=Paenibacillus sp. FJAT-26967 TaxID=1729690 RepID=UPI000838DAE7|nr:helix-turn-helix domain-containing protein [Paenibacillus sp. FJAT-26967]
MRKTKRNVSRVPVLRQQFRAKRKLSHRELGEKVGVTEATVRSTENGRIDPSIFMAFVYSVYLDTKVEDLFSDILERAKAHLDMTS